MCECCVLGTLAENISFGAAWNGETICVNNPSRTPLFSEGTRPKRTATITYWILESDELMIRVICVALNRMNLISFEMGKQWRNCVCAACAFVITCCSAIHGNNYSDSNSHRMRRHRCRSFGCRIVCGKLRGECARSFSHHKKPRRRIINEKRVWMRGWMRLPTDSLLIDTLASIQPNRTTRVSLI